MTDSGNGDDKAAGASDIERHLMRAAADGRTATLAELGGSKAMTIEADRLSRSPLLPELARIFVAAGPDAADGVDRGDGLESLARIVLDGLNVAESPLAFTETLDVVLDSESVLKHLGEQVSAACLARVLQRRKYPALAGAALEGALRLVLGGWVPQYDLLGVLVRLRGPESHLFSRPALRCLGVAYEQWRDERLVRAMALLAGLDGVIPDDLANEARLIECDAALELTIFNGGGYGFG